MSDGDRGRTDAQQPEPDEAAEASQWPLGDIEPELRDLRAAAGLLSHVAASPHEIESEELVSIAGQIIAHHDRLDALWRQAFDAQQREREEQKHEAAEHEIELAAEKTRKAAPGSPADVKHAEWLWGVMTRLAAIITEEAEERTAAAGDASITILAKAGLPPSESGRA